MRDPAGLRTRSIGVGAVDRHGSSPHLPDVARQTPYESFRDLASRLPFQLDDLERVNDLFLAVRKKPDRALEVQLEVWTYCFVRRYFSIKLSRDSLARGADLDGLMDVAYTRIRRSRDDVRKRYGSWVSVVCRNAFLNYVRDRKPFVELDEPEFAVSVPVQPGDPRGSRPAAQVRSMDLTITLAAIDGAISRLPEYLRPIARLRILEDRDYDEIAEIVARPMPTVRAYFHKAVSRLRKDPDVRAVLGKPQRGPATEKRPQSPPLGVMNTDAKVSLSANGLPNSRKQTGSADKPT